MTPSYLASILEAEQLSFHKLLGGWRGWAHVNRPGWSDRKLLANEHRPLIEKSTQRCRITGQKHTERFCGVWAPLLGELGGSGKIFWGGFRIDRSFTVAMLESPPSLSLWSNKRAFFSSLVWLICLILDIDPRPAKTRAVTLQTYSKGHCSTEGTSSKIHS